MPRSDPFATPQAFLDVVLALLIERVETRVQDNFDTAYPADSFAEGGAACVAKRAAYLRFLFEHHERLFVTYARLADEESRALFVDLILFRILGYEHVRLPSNTPAYWAARRACGELSAARSPLNGLPGGANLAHFEIMLGERPLRVDCFRANVFFSFILGQYRFCRKQTVIAPEAGDHVVDAGACFGDTALGFAHAVGPGGWVHAFDMVHAHLTAIDHNIRQNPGLTNIVVHPVALGETDRPGTVSDSEIDPGLSVARANSVPMRTIDSLLAEGRIERVDFIKMDVEGHELPILRGAERAIRRFRPKLAISLYHRADDYFRIPDFIRSLDMSYRLYMENHTISDGETVLYGIPSTRRPPAGQATQVRGGGGGLG